MLNNLLTQEAKKISFRYKISEEEAGQILLDKFAKSKNLSKKINEVKDVRKIYKLKEFKDLVKSVKKEIYYGLRKYKPDAANVRALLLQVENLISEKKYKECNELFFHLAETHISTKERLPFINEFNKQLKDLLGNPENILDIGGGLFPLAFPFDTFINLKNLVWIDKDKESFRILKTFLKVPGREKVKLFCENISKADWESYLPNNTDEFDVVLLIKLIPVIQRQEKYLIKRLLDIPAKRFLITASKESMTKRQSIYFREKETLKEFMALSGRTIVGELNIKNEFGYLLE